MSEAKDYIGFDPVHRIERLREVNESSQFDEKDKALIEGHLLELEDKLVGTLSARGHSDE